MKPRCKVSSDSSTGTTLILHDAGPQCRHKWWCHSTTVFLCLKKRGQIFTFLPIRKRAAGRRRPSFPGYWAGRLACDDMDTDADLGHSRSRARSWTALSSGSRSGLLCLVLNVLWSQKQDSVEGPETVSLVNTRSLQREVGKPYMVPLVNGQFISLELRTSWCLIVFQLL